MHFNLHLALIAASGLLTTTSAAALPEPAVAATANKWSFQIHQSQNCGDGSLALTQAGPGSQQCQPPMEYYYRSVLVTNNNSGRCKITFYHDYTTTNGQGVCTNAVASSPGAITQGKCYNFPATSIPKTYSVTCT